MTILEQSQGPVDFIRWCWNPTYRPKHISDLIEHDPYEFIDLPYEYASELMTWSMGQHHRDHAHFNRIVSVHGWSNDRLQRQKALSLLVGAFKRPRNIKRDLSMINRTNYASGKWEVSSTYYGVPLTPPPAPALALEGFLKRLGLITHFDNLVSSWLSRGLDVNATCTLGRTPLHYAVKVMKVDVVRDLLNAGADPTVTDVYGDTPLHAVAKFWAEKQSSDVNEVVELLLAHGADPKQPNNEGLTPHDLGDFLALERLDRRDRLQEVVAQTRTASVEGSPRRAM